MNISKSNFQNLLPVIQKKSNNQTSQSNQISEITVPQFDLSPTIDGKLDEEVWQKAAVLKDFLQTQPGDNVPANYPTEIRLGYDAKNLYIGIRASDVKGQVRSTVAKRDDLSGNDYTSVWLDTFGDSRRAYVLSFNPLGIQADAVFTEGQTLDYSVDIVMQSKGVLTDDGYMIEIAVPFSSLRYDAGKDKFWGVHVLRKISHLDEWDSWMPLRRESRDFGTSTFTRFLEQEGQIKGIENVGHERNLEFIPNLTFSESGRRVRTIPRSLINQHPALIDNGRFLNSAIKPEIGLTAKLTLASGITLGAAINPDFAQVEADQLVVTANQRYPIFFPEKRPFFLEGIEVFQTPIRAVNTRTIVDPDIALKLTGKRGRNSFGAMLASDNAPGNYSEDERDDPLIRTGIEKFIDKNSFVGVLRYKRDIGKESSIGVIGTSYDFVEKHNRLFGFDGRFVLDPKTTLTFQALGTASRRFFYEPAQDKNIYRTGNGFAYYLQFQRSSPHLNLTLTGDGKTPDYRADVGFAPLTNINRWSLTSQYNSLPKKDGLLISWSAANTATAWFDWQGRMKYGYLNPRILLNFKRQTYINLTVYADYSKLLEEEFGASRNATQTGAFFGAPERSTIYKGITLETGSSPSKRFSFDFSLDTTANSFDYDFGAGRKFPRVSRAALLDPNAPLDPGTGRTLDITADFIVRPTDELNFSFDYIKSRFVRDDTGRTAYDQNLFSLKTVYQFTRFTFAKARVDYDTLQARIYGQFLLGYAPNPGTAFYLGYNDDLNYNNFSSFTGQYEPGLRRNTRTFFIKMSYLFRHRL
ncbi:MAG: carbohydrate binding family 9 domain-containing protein [Actinomycetota bacterium]